MQWAQSRGGERRRVARHGSRSSSVATTWRARPARGKREASARQPGRRRQGSAELQQVGRIRASAKRALSERKPKRGVWRAGPRAQCTVAFAGVGKQRPNCTRELQCRASRWRAVCGGADFRPGFWVDFLPQSRGAAHRSSALALPQRSPEAQNVKRGPASKNTFLKYWAAV